MHTIVRVSVSARKRVAVDGFTTSAPGIVAHYALDENHKPIAGLWGITHERTGKSICLVFGESSDARAVADELAPLADWRKVDPKQGLNGEPLQALLDCVKKHVVRYRQAKAARLGKAVYA